MGTQRKKNSPDMAKEEAIPYAADPTPQLTPPGPPPHPGGRPRLYDGPTVRLNLFLPEESAKVIRIIAVEEGISPSQVVDRWARRAELDRAMVSGLLDIQAGRTIDHEEVERRLSKWS